MISIYDGLAAPKERWCSFELKPKTGVAHSVTQWTNSRWGNKNGQEEANRVIVWGILDFKEAND